MGNWVHRLSDVDVAARTAVCANCGPVSIKVEKNRSPACRKRVNEAAAKYRVGNEERRRRYDLNRRAKNAGATPEEVEDARERQGGLCAICRQPSPNDRDLHRDHSHVTGQFRGLLCHGCNTGLGCFKDNQESLRRAIEYLNIAETANTERC